MMAAWTSAGDTLTLHLLLGRYCFREICAANVIVHRPSILAIVKAFTMLKANTCTGPHHVPFCWILQDTEDQRQLCELFGLSQQPLLLPQQSQLWICVGLQLAWIVVA